MTEMNLCLRGIALSYAPCCPCLGSNACLDVRLLHCAKTGRRSVYYSRIPWSSPFCQQGFGFNSYSIDRQLSRSL